LNRPGPIDARNTPTSTPPSRKSQSSADELITALERLQKLKEAGALTDQEFQHRKSKILEEFDGISVGQQADIQGEDTSQGNIFRSAEVHTLPDPLNVSASTLAKIKKDRR
jgi:hypothetical protein